MKPPAVSDTVLRSVLDRWLELAPPYPPWLNDCLSPKKHYDFEVPVETEISLQPVESVRIEDLERRTISIQTVRTDQSAKHYIVRAGRTVKFLRDRSFFIPDVEAVIDARNYRPVQLAFVPNATENLRVQVTAYRVGRSVQRRGREN